MLCEYAVPMVGVGRVVGVNAMTGQICSVTARVAWQPLASFTRTVIVVAGLAEAVGVPLITPVVALSEAHDGKVPEITL